MGEIITEADIRQAASRQMKVLRAPAGAIVTPAARDAARETGVSIVCGGPPEKEAAGATSPAGKTIPCAVIDQIAAKVISKLDGATAAPMTVNNRIPIGVSNRHVHLAREDFIRLFGAGADLSVLKDLSQPGQFAAKERVILAGPGGSIENVRILGPLRKATQVEILPSDAFRLGIKAPVRDSGDLAGSASLTLVGPAGAVTLKEGVIIAARHIHMEPGDAARLGLADKDRVCAEVGGARGLIFKEVLVRVSPDYRLEMHVDIDEANAAGITNGDYAQIVNWRQSR